MNLSNLEISEIIDEQRRMILRAEHQVATWREIVGMSQPASTHRFALERSERQLAAVQKVAKATLDYLSEPDDVAAIMSETHRIANDPDLWPAASMGKAQIADDSWWVDFWDRQGDLTKALTDTVAKLAARGIDVGVDVMAEIGPAIQAARLS